MNPKKSTAPATPAPAFDEASAKPVTPRRHSDGRTISFEQLDATGAVHGFSATGLFIATRVAKKSAPVAAPVAPAPAQ